MRAAENEVDRIMKETDDIFNANPNREDSGRIIFEKLARAKQDSNWDLVTEMISK